MNGRNGRVNNAAKIKRVAHRAADVIGRDEMMRPNRRAEVRLPAALQVPAAVRFRRGRSRVVFRIAASVENQRLRRQRRRRQQRGDANRLRPAAIGKQGF